MPNNRKQKKIRNYNRYKEYYDAMKPVSIVITNDLIIKTLEEMWLKTS